VIKKFRASVSAKVCVDNLFEARRSTYQTKERSVGGRGGEGKGERVTALGLECSRTSIARTRITRTKFPSPDPNFTEIYPDNSNSALTRTVFRFPSEFELPGFYCNTGIQLRSCTLTS